MSTLNLLTCDIRDLKRLADRHGIACYTGTGGRLIIRPYRGPRTDIHAACVARCDELRDLLSATRPVPFDCDKAADEVAKRVCKMPYQVLIALTIYDLNTRLAQADAGLLTHTPPLPPQWDDDLVHDDGEQSAPLTALIRTRPAGRHSYRVGGRRD